MDFIWGAVAVLLGFGAWQGSRWAWDRRFGRQRRRARSHRKAARQKAWDMVFGRRGQRRLSYRPEPPADDG